MSFPGRTLKISLLRSDLCIKGSGGAGVESCLAGEGSVASLEAGEVHFFNKNYLFLRTVSPFSHHFGIGGAVGKWDTTVISLTCWASPQFTSGLFCSLVCLRGVSGAL